MIKKLRVRFIILNMSMVTLVLLGIFIAITISTSRQMVANSFSYLSNDRARYGLPPAGLNDVNKKTPPRSTLPTTVFWLTINDGVIEFLNEEIDYDYSDEYLTEIVTLATSQDSSRGLLKEYDLRYDIISYPNSDDLTIGYLDASFEQSFLYDQIFNYVLIGIGSLGVFFIISFYLSKIVIKPVEKGYNQQKQFISDVSHELKTPITVILANASILKNEERGTGSKWLEYIEKEANRMRKLVDDLLFLARLDETEVKQVPSLVNLSDALYSCILPFEPVAFEKGISFENDISDDIHVNGNLSQIKRLILILIDNATKYSEKGSNVSISLKSTNDKAILKVHNEGSFIAEEDIDKIFDRFYRADKARERSSNSYGLGLSMAKKITESLRGEISVTSNISTGTTFTVTLHTVNNGVRTKP